MVAAGLPKHMVKSVHRSNDPAKVIEDADAILVGGGNTFKLVHDLHVFDLVSLVQDKARSGTPYMGWSAGANVASPRLCTTNDMPIIDPGGLGALGLVPFQLNCHFTDFTPPGHQGETRRQRISEFLTLHPDETVIGLPEGDWIRGRNDNFILQGPHPAWQFQLRRDAVQLSVGDAIR